MSNNTNVGKVFNLTGGGGNGGSLKLESLAVKNPPIKTIYKSGESFDPTGMMVEAGYGYGLTSDVTGYTVTPSVLTDGVTEVIITYTEGRVTKTAATPVTVEKVLVSIDVTTPPAKTSYDYLESFDPTGMVVTATFSDGSESTATEYSYSPTEFSTLGQQTVNMDYAYEGVTKSTSLNVTVNAIEVAVPTQKDAIVYDGGAKTPTWNGYDSVKMTLSGETVGTNAGDYTAKFTLVYGYVFPNEGNEADAVWTISRAIIPALPAQKNALVADGTSKTPNWDGYIVGQLTIGGDCSGTEAGDYTAEFTPNGNYQWWDGTIETKNVAWTITSVIVPIPTQKGSLTYTGAAQTPQWDNFDMENCSVQVTPAADAGEHSATFTLLQGMWEDGTTDNKIVKWVIGRATIAAVPEQIDIPSYDGNPKTPSWNSNYSSAKMTLSVESKTNAGTTYTATFTPTSNYQWWDGTTEEKSATWAISRATISTIPSQSGSLTYSGSVQSPQWTGYDSTKLTIGGTISSTNAGTFVATFTPTANYQWSDGSTTSKSVNWSMNKAAGSLSLNKTSVTLNSDKLSDTVTVTRAGDGVISSTSSDTSVATVSINGNIITVNHVNQKSGSATITVAVAASTNHNASANKIFTVNAEFIPAKAALDTMSWADIRKVSDAGLASSYWSVGDTKGLQINGTIGLTSINKKVYAFILGFNHNSAKEGTKRIHFQIGKTAASDGKQICFVEEKYGKTNSLQGSFTMNPASGTSSSTNAGGWNRSHIRNTVLGAQNSPTNPGSNTLLAALPSDLRAVMKSVTKYSDNTGGNTNTANAITATTDYLFLLAEFEVQGVNSYANQYEQNFQVQYDYYKNGNSKVFYNYSSTSSAVHWYLRSVRAGGSNQFCYVYTDGIVKYEVACLSTGVAPAFCV